VPAQRKVEKVDVVARRVNRDRTVKRPTSAVLAGLLLTIAGVAVGLLAIFVVLLVAPAFMPPHAPTTPP
jgi:hypothetical protein